MKLSEMDSDEAKEKLYRAYMGAHEAYDGDNNEHGQHPSRDYRRWVDIAATGGQNSEKPIQSQDDDPQPEKTANGNGGNGGPTPAQDGRFTIQSDGVPRFEAVNAKGDTVSIVTGDAALEARSRQSNPTRAANMASRIKGYNRIP